MCLPEYIYSNAIYQLTLVQSFFSLLFDGMKNGNKSTITSNNILLNRYDHMPRVAFNILEEKKM